MYILGLSFALGLHALTDYCGDTCAAVWCRGVQRGCLLGVAHSHVTAGIRRCLEMEMDEGQHVAKKEVLRRHLGTGEATD